MTSQTYNQSYGQEPRQRGAYQGVPYGAQAHTSRAYQASQATPVGGAPQPTCASTSGTPQPAPHAHRAARTKSRARLLATLGVVLVCLLAAAAFAKYAASTQGEDAARVASFQITVADAQTNKDLQLGYSSTTQTYALTVSNQNADGSVTTEVKTAYDVIVTFPSAIECVGMTITNGSKSVTGTTSDNITYTFSNVGEFAASTAKTDSLTLTFNLDTEKITTQTWSNIDVSVKASQKQS